MPRATKISAHVMNTSISQENSVSQESSSSDQEMEVQSPSFQPSTGLAQFVPPMFIPYIEVPQGDWTFNDGLYYRFLKWKLKCENILDCELAMSPVSKKCKNHSMVWGFRNGSICFLCLPAEDLCLDTIWAKYEDFCKPQVNKIKARFDLLPNFRQGNRLVY